MLISSKAIIFDTTLSYSRQEVDNKVLELTDKIIDVETTVNDRIDSFDDTFVDKAGSTMTGSLILNGSPTTENMAVNKIYVDDLILDIKNSSFTFMGYISSLEPTTDLREGNLWYNKSLSPSELPDISFPWNVKVYKNNTWNNDQIYNIPDALDLWYDIDNLEAWYYLGNTWERLDFSGSAFNSRYFDVNNGSVTLKNNSLDNNLIAVNANIEQSKIKDLISVLDSKASSDKATNSSLGLVKGSNEFMKAGIDSNGEIYINGVIETINEHKDNYSNPHKVTKEQLDINYASIDDTLQGTNLNVVTAQALKGALTKFGMFGYANREQQHAVTSLNEIVLSGSYAIFASNPILDKPPQLNAFYLFVTNNGALTPTFVLQVAVHVDTNIICMRVKHKDYWEDWIELTNINNLNGVLDLIHGGTGRSDGMSQGIIETRNNTITTFWTGTQVQYDAIIMKNLNTLYFITG